MSTIVMNKKDELVMKLVHYFITEQNYSPIVVNGVKDEIWLENSEGPYRIVRINSNNIFNKEQLSYDYFKIDNIVRQIKKKTLSFSVNTLNILLDVNEDLEVEPTKTIQSAVIVDNDVNIEDKAILEAFPNINDKLIKDAAGVELIINVTKDINEKTEKENRKYEKAFKPKKIVVTNIIMILCAFMFAITLLFDGINGLLGVKTITALKLGANNSIFVTHGEPWRLFTYMFLHGSILHLLINMYSLFILGSQTETFLGKWKLMVIYIVSGICGGILSCVVGGETVTSVGASGAIFGLTGALLYFGYHFRTYLGEALKNQVIPVIIVNLVLGFSISAIDNWCHIGGLVGGFLVTMALGVDGKSKTSERINGAICLIAYFAIFGYLLFR